MRFGILAGHVLLIGACQAAAADSAAAFNTTVAGEKAPADAKVASRATAGSASQETWQQRQERLQREQQFRQRAADLKSRFNRPTQWQLQNPSGAWNQYPTELPRGYIAPNSYYGPAYRSWTNLSPPVSMMRMPAGYNTPPLATISNAPMTTNTWWGTANQSWSGIRIGGATPSAMGGWNYVPGN